MLTNETLLSVKIVIIKHCHHFYYLCYLYIIQIFWPNYAALPKNKNKKKPPEIFRKIANKKSFSPNHTGFKYNLFNIFFILFPFLLMSMTRSQ